jgi:hypothetical protein
MFFIKNPHFFPPAIKISYFFSLSFFVRGWETWNTLFFEKNGLSRTKPLLIGKKNFGCIKKRGVLFFPIPFGGIKISFFKIFRERWYRILDMVTLCFGVIWSRLLRFQRHVIWDGQGWWMTYSAILLLLI